MRIRGDAVVIARFSLKPLRSNNSERSESRAKFASLKEFALAESIVAATKGEG